MEHPISILQITLCTSATQQKLHDSVLVVILVYMVEQYICDRAGVGRVVFHVVDHAVHVEVCGHFLHAYLQRPRLRAKRPRSKLGRSHDKGAIEVSMYGVLSD